VRSRGVKRFALVAVMLCLLCTFLAPSAFATGQGGTPIIYQRDNGDRNIALTFDDGPHPTYTAEILDILAEYGIHATFFVIGENAEQYPDLLQREMNEGHEIGNHTQTHPLRNLSREQMEQEISACETTIGELLDRRTHLFRPPGGIISQTVMTLAEDHSYRVILWSIDTRDWAHSSIRDITKNVLDHISDGDIILMHDAISKSSPTPDALRILIPELLARGYHFVTVSELLAEN